ncbi:hypothetical protein J7643_14295 [bacterium]|nr:hypothetical protein [bacterium]
MKQTQLHTLAILALSVAIAGCATPTLLGGRGAPSRVDAAQPAATGGTVELHLHWPDKQVGYGAQAIPNRATHAVVTLTEASGSVHTAELARPTAPAPEPTPNKDGMTSQGMEGGPPAPMGGASWRLAQQEGVTLKAELFDQEGRSVGSATRTVDVIAGYHSVVALDILVEGAPKLEVVNPTAFKIGDRIVLEGRNFGLSHPDWSPAGVYLESEGTYAWGSAFGPETHQYRNMVYLPPSSVKVVSDSRIEVTIPSSMENGWHFVDALWNYFHANGNQQLYLGVTVDGVNSNRVPVSIPRGTSAGVTVTVEQGREAPSREAATASVDLTAAPFGIPAASGSKWVFEVAGTDGDRAGGTQTMSVQLLNDDGEALVSSNAQGAPTSGWRTNLRWDWQWGFMRSLSAPAALGIQVLPDEQVPMPGGGTAIARHLFYTAQGGPDATSVRDLWVVPGVGPVRIREVTLHANQDPGSEGKGMARQTREYRLVAFEPPAGPAPVRQ